MDLKEDVDEDDYLRKEVCSKTNLNIRIISVR